MIFRCFNTNQVSHTKSYHSCWPNLWVMRLSSLTISSLWFMWIIQLVHMADDEVGPPSSPLGLRHDGGWVRISGSGLSREAPTTGGFRGAFGGGCGRSRVVRQGAVRWQPVGIVVYSSWEIQSADAVAGAGGGRDFISKMKVWCAGILFHYSLRS